MHHLSQEKLIYILTFCLGFALIIIFIMVALLANSYSKDNDITSHMQGSLHLQDQTISSGKVPSHSKNFFETLQGSFDSKKSFENQTQTPSQQKDTTSLVTPEKIAEDSGFYYVIDHEGNIQETVR